MEIRKIAGIALAFTVAVGAFCAPFPFFENTTASAEDAAAQETENTDDTGSSGSDTGSSGSDESPDADVSVHLTPENAALVLPESYEQYLPLTSPSSVAMSEDYIAIADGTTLYLYDRAAGVYETYTPTQGENFPTPSPAIGTISFSDDGTLISVTDDFGEDVGVAAFSVFEFFDNENACAFAHNESVALSVERAAGMERIVVTGTECLEGAEPGQAERHDGCFRAAAYHHISVIALDHPVCFADGVRSGGACGHDAHIGSLSSGTDRDITAGEVADHHRNEER